VHFHGELLVIVSSRNQGFLTRGNVENGK